MKQSSCRCSITCQASPWKQTLTQIKDNMTNQLFLFTSHTFHVTPPSLSVAVGAVLLSDGELSLLWRSLAPVPSMLLSLIAPGDHVTFPNTSGASSASFSWRQVQSQPGVRFVHVLLQNNLYIQYTIIKWHVLFLCDTIECVLMHSSCNLRQLLYGSHKDGQLYFFLTANVG